MRLLEHGRLEPVDQVHFAAAQYVGMAGQDVLGQGRSGARHADDEDRLLAAIAAAGEAREELGRERRLEGGEFGLHVSDGEFEFGAAGGVGLGVIAGGAIDLPEVFIDLAECEAERNALRRIGHGVDGKQVAELLVLLVVMPHQGEVQMGVAGAGLLPEDTPEGLGRELQPAETTMRAGDQAELGRRRRQLHGLAQGRDGAIGMRRGIGLARLAHQLLERCRGFGGRQGRLRG